MGQPTHLELIIGSLSKMRHPFHSDGLCFSSPDLFIHVRSGVASLVMFFIEKNSKATILGDFHYKIPNSLQVKHKEAISSL